MTNLEQGVDMRVGGTPGPWRAFGSIVALDAWLVWRTLTADAAAGAAWYAYGLVGALTTLLRWIAFVPLKLRPPVVLERSPC